jgi:hypothetical protein
MSHLNKTACLLLAVWGQVVVAADDALPDAATLRVSYAPDSGAGVGAEIAWDAGERWRVHAGFEHYSGEQEHLISLIRFTENRERTDVGLFLDRKLAGNSGWYVSAGIIHPDQGARWDANPDSRMAYTLNDRQYAGVHLSEPEGRVEYAALAPYVGVGWRASAAKGWQVGAEIGVLAGLDPKFSIHTDNPYQLPYLEQDLQAEADQYLATAQADTHLSGDQQLKASVSLSYHF